MKVIAKTVMYIVLAFVLLLGGIIAYGTFTDYKPTHKENLKIVREGIFNTVYDSTLSIFSWNMGYCGLGKNMDFFYDGGKRVKPTKEDFQKYLNGALNFLAKYDTVNMFLLQEVDTNAKRTYYTNEADLIGEFLPAYSYAFAKNYDARFVPLPWYEPMGKVISGIMTLSKIKMVDAVRYPFYANFDWPKGVFMLKRCMIYSKLKVPGGKYLIVLNIHGSAFDEAADLRDVEASVIKSVALDEYERGNYVVIGGDWNRNPPLLDLKKMTNTEAKRTIDPPLDKDFLPPGWKCVFDPTLPSNRDVDKAYVKGKTKTTIIDFFYISPNLMVLENKTIPTGWEFSDHQPVYMRVKMKPAVSSNVFLSKADNAKIEKKKASTH